MPESLIRARDVRVEFPGFTLGPIDIDLPPGVHGLLGPNGAGKTTLVNTLLGLQERRGGQVEALGVALNGRAPDVLRQVGIVPDTSESLPQELTAWEFWRLVARLVGAPQDQGELLATAERLAAELDFRPPDAPIASFSLGMRKKTQVVAALLHDPVVVVMDEPRNGLDPLAIRRLEQLLQDLRARGACVLVASHDLWWADRIADSVHVLADGRMIASGAPSALKAPGEESLVDTYVRLVGAAG